MRNSSFFPSHLKPPTRSLEVGAVGICGTAGEGGVSDRSLWIESGVSRPIGDCMVDRVPENELFGESNSTDSL